MVNKKKSSLSRRYQASYESKESGGSKQGVMNFRKVEGDVNFFSPSDGRNRINIIPYTIKTKNHPLVKRGEFEIGDKDYVMDIFVHRGVGPSEESVLCLKKTYGKPCPICEQAALLRKQGKEKESSALNPSRRVFYNVEDLKDPGTLKVFEVSHYLFEKELIDEARDDEDGGFVDFADEESGKEIKFRCSKVKKGTFEFNEFKSFSFEDRDDPISDELLDSAISFDEIMNVPTYEEAEKILFGSDDDEDSDDQDEYEEPVKKSSKKHHEEEDDDDEEYEEPVKKPAKKRHVEEDDEDDSDEDDDDEPVKKSSKKSKKEVEEDDDDEEQDEEPEEKPAKKCKSCGSGKCPFGHKYGEDVDEYDDCDECDIWDKCVNGK